MDDRAWQEFKRWTPRRRAEWVEAIDDRTLAAALDGVARMLIETESHDPSMPVVLMVKEAAQRLRRRARVR